LSRHEDFLWCRDESKKKAYAHRPRCGGGADAVARDVCEAIVVDGSSLTKAKQVVCQPLLSAIRQQLAHGVKGLIPFDGYSASKAEMAINAPVAGIAEAPCAVLVRVRFCHTSGKTTADNIRIPSSRQHFRGALLCPAQQKCYRLLNRP
jgi:hypothetical protein